MTHPCQCGGAVLTSRDGSGIVVEGNIVHRGDRPCYRVVAKPELDYAELTPGHDDEGAELDHAVIAAAGVLVDADRYGTPVTCASALMRLTVAVDDRRRHLERPA